MSPHEKQSPLSNVFMNLGGNVGRWKPQQHDCFLKPFTGDYQQREAQSNELRRICK